jgi:hypothetical protein
MKPGDTVLMKNGQSGRFLGRYQLVFPILHTYRHIIRHGVIFELRQSSRYVFESTSKSTSDDSYEYYTRPVISDIISSESLDGTELSQIRTRNQHYAIFKSANGMKTTIEFHPNPSINQPQYALMPHRFVLVDGTYYHLDSSGSQVNEIRFSDNKLITLKCPIDFNELKDPVFVKPRISLTNHEEHFTWEIGF